MEHDTEIKKLRSDSAELSDGVADLLRYAAQHSSQIQEATRDEREQRGERDQKTEGA